MGGLVGAALLPSVRDAFVIGLGTGSTAGWLARIPEMERVDVAELEPVILRVARECSVVNENVLENPKVHVSMGDARELLLTARRQYDLIFSEPSNPYRAGIASLYTREFYEAAAAAMRPRGVFLQWLQLYDIDGFAVQTAIATIASVFPEVSVWQTLSADLVLVASREPLPVDPDRLRTRLAGEPFRRAMTVAWEVDDLEGFLSHHVASPAFARSIAALPGVPVNTDDRNVLEYALSRSLGKSSAIHPFELWKTSRTMGLDRPALVKGVIDWNRVDMRRMILLGTNETAFVTEALPPSARALHGDYLNHRAGDLASLRKSWEVRPKAALSPSELWLYADALASAGSDDATPLIAQVAAYDRTSASILEAHRLYGKEDYATSASVLHDALLRCRTDPWPGANALSRGIGLAGSLASRDASLAPRLLDALSEPFAAASYESVRLMARVRLVQEAGPIQHCPQVFAPFEPLPLWDRGFLENRLACYRTVGHALAAHAERDLAQFVDSASMPISAGLIEVPPQ